MAIPTFDSGSIGNTSGLNVASQTIAFTIGDNTAKYFGAWVRMTASEPKSINTLTLNGVTMVRRAYILSSTETFISMEYWDMLAPPAGTYNIVITPSKSLRLGWALSSWYNVNQTLPTGSIVTAQAVDSTISNTVTSATGEMVIDGAGSANTRTFTLGADQTLRGKVETNDNFVHSSQIGAASVPMTWDIVGGADNWISIALPLKPTVDAPVGGGGASPLITGLYQFTGLNKIIFT